jgi:hypothetical protein
MRIDKKIILWRAGSNAAIARQQQVKQFHGYAGLSNHTTWLHGNQEWENSTIGRPVFLLGQPDVIQGRHDAKRFEFQQLVEGEQSVPVSSGYESVSPSEFPYGVGRNWKVSRNCQC